ncbi:hypothetical protein A165_22885 [Vibrio tasmaniensis ZS-17]|uniref:Uncharacterized protein n=1 Tax=Vibrio lentus TaxID=136468 RepID=A0A2N7I8Z3_9VIBR|nr:hypothetical protein A165_22885 [Vibrio tasmaniensis ZS-17]PML52805.1 hypothetical protein BCT74_14310 [Vibrio lentus]PMM34812.1 hypothetical protein BCT58_26265 [Vibrio lentus]
MHAKPLDTFIESEFHNEDSQPNKGSEITLDLLPCIGLNITKLLRELYDPMVMNLTSGKF